MKTIPHETDERIYCGDCLNFRLRDWWCIAQKTTAWPADRLLRCQTFAPGEGVEDRRTGLQRWPHLLTNIELSREGK